MRRLYGTVCARLLIPCYRLGVWLCELVFGRMNRKIRRRDIRIMEENYLHNREFDGDPRTSTKDKIVNDQSGATGRRFRYGDFCADYNACEVIALHNALVLTDSGSTLCDVLKTVQQQGGMFCRGKWGTKLSRLGRIAQKGYGLSARAVRRIERLDRDGVYIMSFWNCERDVLRGLHTVALRREGDVFTVYNLSAHRAVTLSAQELSSRYKGGFIIGYRIWRG